MHDEIFESEAADDAGKRGRRQHSVGSAVLNLKPCTVRYDVLFNFNAESLPVPSITGRAPLLDAPTKIGCVLVPDDWNISAPLQVVPRRKRIESPGLKLSDETVATEFHGLACEPVPLVVALPSI